MPRKTGSRIADAREAVVTGAAIFRWHLWLIWTASRLWAARARVAADLVIVLLLLPLGMIDRQGIGRGLMRFLDREREQGRARMAALVTEIEGVIREIESVDAAPDDEDSNGGDACR